MQVNLGAVSQQATLEFKTKRAQELAKKIFPEEFYTEGFKEILQKSLRYCSPNKIGVHEETWSVFVKFDRPMFMAEIVTALNVIAGATAAELNISLEEQLNMMQSVVVPMSKKWAEIDREVSLPIKNKIESAYKRQGVPIGESLIDY